MSIRVYFYAACLVLGIWLGWFATHVWYMREISAIELRQTEAVAQAQATLLEKLQDEQAARHKEGSDYEAAIALLKDALAAKPGPVLVCQRPHPAPVPQAGATGGGAAAATPLPAADTFSISPAAIEEIAGECDAQVTGLQAMWRNP